MPDTQLSPCRADSTTETRSHQRGMDASVNLSSTFALSTKISLGSRSANTASAQSVSTSSAITRPRVECTTSLYGAHQFSALDSSDHAVTEDHDLPIDSEYNWERPARSAVTASRPDAAIQVPDEVNLLLMLLYFLDSSTIRRDTLIRGGSIQPHWNQ